MSEYDRPERYEVIKRGLKKFGLEYKHAGKHDVAIDLKTEHKTTVPRHKTKLLKKYTVGSICEFLLETDTIRLKSKKHLSGSKNLEIFP